MSELKECKCPTKTVCEATDCGRTVVADVQRGALAALGIHERETEPALTGTAVEKVLADIVEDEDGADVVPITRQQRRAQERAAQKEAQSLVHVTKEHYDKLHRARIMLAALVRREGRVRIARRELELQRGDKLDVKVQENGDLMVTFKTG